MSFRVDMFETKTSRTPVPGNLRFPSHWQANTFGESLGGRFRITETSLCSNATFIGDDLKINLD